MENGNFKVIMFSCKNLIIEFKTKFIEKVKLIYKKSYFKVNFDCDVNSFLVPLNTKLGKKVWIDKGVNIISNVEIGDYTCINKDAYIESGVIGKFTLIAANVSIGLNEHPIEYLSTHVATYEMPYFGLIKEKKFFEQPKLFQL